MREQRHGAHRTVRPVEQCGERLALGIGEVELFGGHGRLLRFRQVARVSRIVADSEYVTIPGLQRIITLRFMLRYDRENKEI
jgi:hypothetical protein